MSPDEHGGNPYRINRREALKRAALVTGAAWAAPVLTSIRTPAFAQYGVPCEEGCDYVVNFQQPTLTCSPCQDVCLAGCQTGENCAGPGCARITSVTTQDGIVRVCTDCQLDPVQANVCWHCPDPFACTCADYSIDVSDPRCALVPDVFAPCPNREFDLFFRCSAC